MKTANYGPGFYTIVGKDSFKVFGVIQNAEGPFTGKLTLCQVFVVKRGDGRCCCEFNKLTTDCPKHLWKPFAWIKSRDIIPFYKFSDGVIIPDSGTYIDQPQVGYAKLFSIFWFDLPNEAVREICQFLPAIHCGRCGEWLTNPNSIQQGIGPICLEKQNENSF